ncbi:MULTISPECIES: MSMEG_0565 family glycosyltransferase [Rhizobium]|uniref:MSMEG_0565 family glycosyltransferase n=1 Tax=Rhizobium rhododendri TaxID=2506430 RepID=A0ABY8IEZ3_9HYPH|nr:MULTISPECIES: MSMEG_0565 family glycosyltransferase [Rhizobium]MBZ5762662.1 MSMEG_0565 family glycosyltransferase [Rhizobium sp. VS19-DR96]MBZ5768654.1 MSMEG_0565 family glycosyltransferase [Rhizobium sp. VS19-DR129.2]MBZ5776168.1 MSMEG_0565 family glycosyltransferase [Rhizobium sp. VS19-DRK62.2]MBZ5787392.1 MSMEG_0565 family glycosyltransferase [Rhizobium sp. VS19-DR121]MBZ5804680.1 MSMEG_0565 family glycosyltransferase [Rhizobium sp. VS19-DR181]
MTRPLRIAMLTHSTNPRGGVVHAMQLSEALTATGHEVVLHAPDTKGTGFFRPTACETAGFKVQPAATDMTAMVEQRIEDYVSYFERAGAGEFDIFHAHDGISGNALVTLKARGMIPAFVRTVHHIDQFADPRLMALQDRSITSANAFFAVSALWQTALQTQHGITSTVVGNGVDTQRFAPAWSGEQAALHDRIGLQPGPVFLSIGGIEARKNTIGILDAFRQLRAVKPDAQLVIAGGVSLLDHSAYHEEFHSHLRSLHDDASAVHIIGAVSDDDMPNLYRLADALVFPSLKEGFGLVVLEAMASGTPAIVPSIAPFTEYLCSEDAIWCDPHHSASIAEAMALSLVPKIRDRIIARGLEVAGRFSWRRVAEAHLSTYATLKEAANA